MRFVDDKGRLFGIINIFDLFIIGILILTAVFAVRWAKVADDPPWVKVRLMNVRCIGLMQVPSYVASLVKEGDQTVDSDNVVMARIEKILSNEAHPVATYVSKDGDKLFFNEDIRDIAVVVDVSAYEKKGGTYTAIASELLRVGISVTMDTKTYSGMIHIRKILGEHESNKK